MGPADPDAALRAEGSVSSPAAAIVLRLAESDDAAALVRLAALDSAAYPEGQQVVAEIDGELVAAVSLANGSRIADPFQRTTAIVELLVMHAAQLDDDGRLRGHANLKECPKATPSIEPLAA